MAQQLQRFSAATTPTETIVAAIHSDGGCIVERLFDEVTIAEMREAVLAKAVRDAAGDAAPGSASHHRDGGGGGGAARRGGAASSSSAAASSARRKSRGMEIFKSPWTKGGVTHLTPSMSDAYTRQQYRRFGSTQ